MKLKIMVILSAMLAATAAFSYDRYHESFDSVFARAKQRRGKPMQIIVHEPAELSGIYSVTFESEYP
jgi:hypothetical protein